MGAGHQAVVGSHQRRDVLGGVSGGGPEPDMGRQGEAVGLPFRPASPW